MPQTDAVAYIHGTGASVGPITGIGTTVVGDPIFQSTTSTYSNLELDFGAPASGSAYPYLPAFPSLTEKGYSFPPEILGDGGVEQGVHLIIGQAVSGGSITSGTINVTSSAASSATAIVASRNFTSGQLGTSGAHYFIPVSGPAVLEFLRCAFVPNTGAAGSGTGVAWYGPKTGGEQ